MCQFVCWFESSICALVHVLCLKPFRVIVVWYKQRKKFMLYNVLSNLLMLTDWIIKCIVFVNGFIYAWWFLNLKMSAPKLSQESVPDEPRRNDTGASESSDIDFVRNDNIEGEVLDDNDALLAMIEQDSEEMNRDRFAAIFASVMARVEQRRIQARAENNSIREEQVISDDWEEDERTIPENWDDDDDQPPTVTVYEDPAYPNGRPVFGDDTQCSICLETDIMDKVLLACGHLFHERCYLQWRSMHNTCPLCRAVVMVRLNAQSDDICEVELGVEVGHDELGTFHEELDDHRVYGVGTRIFYCIRTDSNVREYQVMFPRAFLAHLERDEGNIYITTDMIEVIRCGEEYARYPGNPWEQFLRFRITLGQRVRGDDLRIVARACESEPVLFNVQHIQYATESQLDDFEFSESFEVELGEVSVKEVELDLATAEVVGHIQYAIESHLEEEVDLDLDIVEVAECPVIEPEINRFLVVNYGTKGDIALTRVLQRTLGSVIIHVIHEFAAYTGVLSVLSSVNQLADFELKIELAIRQFKPTALLSVTFAPVLVKVAQIYQLPVIFCTGANMCLNGRRIGVGTIEKVVMLINDKVMQYTHDRDIITMAMVPEFLNVSNASLPTRAIGWIAPELQDLNEQVSRFACVRTFAYLRKTTEEERFILERFAQAYHQRVFISGYGKNTEYVMYQNNLEVQYFALFQVVKIAVVHGGFNTVNEALASGVQLMVFPVGLDQLQYSLAMNDHGFGIQFATHIRQVIAFYSSLDRLHAKPIRFLISSTDSQFRERFFQCTSSLPSVCWSQEPAIRDNLIYYCGFTYDIVHRVKCRGRAIEVMFQFRGDAVAYIDQGTVQVPSSIKTRWPADVVEWISYARFNVPLIVRNEQEILPLTVARFLCDKQCVSLQTHVVISGRLEYVSRELLVASMMYTRFDQLSVFDTHALRFGFNSAKALMQPFYTNGVIDERTVDIYLYILSLGKDMVSDQVKAIVQDDVRFNIFVEHFQFQFPILFPSISCEDVGLSIFVRLVASLCSKSYLHFYGVNSRLERDLYPIRRTVGPCLVHELCCVLSQDLHYLICSCQGGAFRYSDVDSLKFIYAVHQRENQYCAIILAHYLGQSR